MQPISNAKLLSRAQSRAYTVDISHGEPRFNHKHPDHCPCGARCFTDGQTPTSVSGWLNDLVVLLTLGIYTSWLHILAALTVAAFFWRPAAIALAVLLGTLLLPARPLRWEALLQSTLFVCWRRYFHFSFLFEEDLDTTKDYLFAQFPHGAFPLGPMLGGTSMACEFPKFKVYSLVATNVFLIPGWRHFLSWLGGRPATREQFRRFLAFADKRRPPLAAEQPAEEAAEEAAEAQQEPAGQAAETRRSTLDVTTEGKAADAQHQSPAAEQPAGGGVGDKEHKPPAAAKQRTEAEAASTQQEPRAAKQDTGGMAADAPAAGLAKQADGAAAQGPGAADGPGPLQNGQDVMLEAEDAADAMAYCKRKNGWVRPWALKAHHAEDEQTQAEADGHVICGSGCSSPFAAAAKAPMPEEQQDRAQQQQQRGDDEPGAGQQQEEQQQQQQQGGKQAWWDTAQLQKQRSRALIRHNSRRTPRQLRQEQQERQAWQAQDRRWGIGIALVVGGIAEMFLQSMRKEKIYLHNRKGFVALALEAGIDIVPVYSFGNSALLSYTAPEWIASLCRRLRVSIGLIHGRWGLVVPRKRPVMMAVGRIVRVGAAMSREDPKFDGRVRELHGQVVAEVTRLYHAHRDLFGWGDRPLDIL